MKMLEYIFGILLIVALFLISIKLEQTEKAVKKLQQQQQQRQQFLLIDEIYMVNDEPYIVQINSIISGRNLGNVLAQPGREQNEVAAWCNYHQILLTDVDWK